VLVRGARSRPPRQRIQAALSTNRPPTFLGIARDASCVKILKTSIFASAQISLSLVRGHDPSLSSTAPRPVGDFVHVNDSQPN